MIVTTAMPIFVGSAVVVAKTYRVGDHSFGATVSNPFELILVPGATAPVPSAFGLTLQETV